MHTALLFIALFTGNLVSGQEVIDKDFNSFYKEEITESKGIVIVNFWATWCPPCREEMPAFSRLQERYAAQGVQFVGIALDSVENVRTYHALSPVSYPLLIGGPEGGALARDLGNKSLSLPYTVVINPQGEVRLMQMGALAESDLERILARTADR